MRKLPTPKDVALGLCAIYKATRNKNHADKCGECKRIAAAIRADRLRVLDEFTERWLTTQDPELTILRDLRREIEQP